LLPHSKV